MKTFNIGDRVRAVKDSRYYPIFKKGDKGTVIDNINSTTVKFDKRDGIWKCIPDEIELIEQPEVIGKVIKGKKHQPKFYLDDDDIVPEPFPSFEEFMEWKIRNPHIKLQELYDYFAQFGVREVQMHPNSQHFDLAKFIYEYLMGIGGNPTPKEIYDEFNTRVKDALRIPQNYGIQTVEVFPEVDGIIKLSKFEIQSGIDRVNHAEGLISQLPAMHDGRNTWLLNYGRRKESWDKRAKKMLGWNRDTQSAEIRPIQPSRLDELKARKSELSRDEKDELIELLIETLDKWEK